MSIWNKVLLGLIFVATLGFAHAVIRDLKTHEFFRNQMVLAQRKLDSIKKENRKLVEADKLDNGKLGTVAAKRDLNRLLVLRGRVWRNCEPTRINSETGQVTLTTDEPVPHGITDKLIVYAFEDLPARQNGQGGHYLGEFKVIGVSDNLADRKVAIEPTMQLEPDERARLTANKGTWTLLEIMPVDRHDIWADVEDADKKEMLPATSVSEFLKDGKAAEDSDRRDLVYNGKYVRRLRDYRNLFHDYHLQRTLLMNLYAEAVHARKYIGETLADAKRLATMREAEVASLRKEKEEELRQLDTVAKHLAAVKFKLAKIQDDIARIIQENLTLAADIAKYQLEAARRIDARTRTMARTETGAN